MIVNVSHGPSATRLAFMPSPAPAFGDDVIASVRADPHLVAADDGTATRDLDDVERPLQTEGRLTCSESDRERKPTWSDWHHEASTKTSTLVTVTHGKARRKS